MRTNVRRRSRLRSQSVAERWKPTPSVAVVVVGLLLGLALGFRDRLTDQTGQVQQDYMLLVSDLYYQGTPLASVRDRLIKIGFADPSLAVVQSGDQLAASSDKVKQQEGDQLHQFAEALASGVDRNAPPPVVAQASPTILPASAPTAIVTPAPAFASSATSATPVPADAPTAVAAAAAEEPAAPAAAAPPSAASTHPTTSTAGGRTGVVVSADQKPVFLRHDPTTKSKAVASMPVGATVTVKATVVGVAVNPGENHWYHVVYSGIDGYVYSPFVQVGG